MKTGRERYREFRTEPQQPQRKQRHRTTEQSVLSAFLVRATRMAWENRFKTRGKRFRKSCGRAAKDAEKQRQTAI